MHNKFNVVPLAIILMLQIIIQQHSSPYDIPHSAISLRIISQRSNPLTQSRDIKQTWNLAPLSSGTSTLQVTNCQVKCSTAPKHVTMKNAGPWPFKWPAYAKQPTKSEANTTRIGRTQPPNKSAVDLTPIFASSARS